MTSMHHSIRVGAALGSPYRRRGLPLRARAVYATAASAVPLTLALTLAATTVPGAAQDTTPPQWPDPIAAPVKVGRLYSGNAPVLRPQIALPTPSKQPETQRPLDTTPRPVKGGASDPLTSSAPAGGVATHPKIHVVYAGDKETVPGVKMSIRSLLRSARRPDDVIIHFIGDEPLSELPNVDFISVKELDAKYDLLRFSGGKIEDGHGNLNAPANYARFVLADIFHDAQKILWLDGDTLVKCDVADLVHPALKKSPHVIAAVVRPSNRRTIDYAKYGPTVLSTMSTSWNAGVFVVDLERWRNSNITETIAAIASRNRKERFYRLGSQPPMVLAFENRIEALDHKWNVDGLGWMLRKTSKFGKVSAMKRRTACILHWTGRHKPWLHGGGYKQDWRLPPEHAGRKAKDTLQYALQAKRASAEAKIDDELRTAKDTASGQTQNQQGNTRPALHLGSTFATNQHFDNTSKVHVVYGGDAATSRGVAMSMRSLLRHARRPDDVILHYIGTEPLASLPDVHYISIEEIGRKYNLLARFAAKAVNDSEIDGHKTISAEYARFVLPSIFPGVDKVLWLDGDTFIKCDVTDLVRPALRSTQHPVGVILRPGRLESIDYSKFGETPLTEMTTSWEGGVFVADLRRWRESNLTEAIERIVQRNRQTHFYRGGTHSAMALAIGTKFEELPKKWNVGGLGFKPVSLQERRRACLLHWNGGRKPWLERGQYKAEWALPET